MTSDATRPDSTPTLADVILDMCARTKPGGTIGPIEAAQAFATARGEDDLAWRRHLPHVRKAAVDLADTGRLVIYRKGRPVDPHDFRGVYRLGAPRID